MIKMPLTIFAVIAVAACTAPGSPDRLTAFVPAPDVAPESCVSLSRIQHTHVISDSVIDFELARKEIWRNELPYRCPGLGFEESFSYKTTLSRLCSSDTITVIRRGAGGIPGPSCGLGEFRKMVPAIVEAKTPTPAAD